jgi:phage terminase large subunit
VSSLKNKTLADTDAPSGLCLCLNPAGTRPRLAVEALASRHMFAEMMIEEHIINPNQSSVCVREIQKSLNQSV